MCSFNVFIVDANSTTPVYLGKAKIFGGIHYVIRLCKKPLLLFTLAGAYDDEEAAARAYDLAALKYWGPGTLINFPVRDLLIRKI